MRTKQMRLLLLLHRQPAARCRHWLPLPQLVARLGFAHPPRDWCSLPHLFLRIALPQQHLPAAPRARGRPPLPLPPLPLLLRHRGCPARPVLSAGCAHLRPWI